MFLTMLNIFINLNLYNSSGDDMKKKLILYIIVIIILIIALVLMFTNKKAESIKIECTVLYNEDNL